MGNLGVLELPKKSNIEIALAEQIKALPGVQAEMIKKHVAIWRWNETRIRDIQTTLKNGKLAGESIDTKIRTDLINERHKLVSENSQLYSHINRALSGKVEEVDELDAFMQR